ncbi:hypothetical protein [Bradyrhizobium sp. URHC0002]
MRDRFDIAVLPRQAQLGVGQSGLRQAVIQNEPGQVIAIAMPQDVDNRRRIHAYGSVQKLWGLASHVSEH